MESRTPTAIQFGLMPGFALQDGDLLARLIWNAGAWGLGATVDIEGHPHGNNNFHEATPITNSFTVVHPSHSNNGLRLPHIAAGSMVRVYNTGSTHAHIFPADQEQRIDAVPPGQSVWLSGGARCDYVYVGDNRWLSNLLGGASA